MMTKDEVLAGIQLQFDEALEEYYSNAEDALGALMARLYELQVSAEQYIGIISADDLNQVFGAVNAILCRILVEMPWGRRPKGS